MSPEQCSQASEIDSRSDIYSLGVIIYEMLTGHVPFTADSPTAIMMKHLQEPPPSVMEERDDLPPQVGMVITSALAKRPEDRFQTAGELSEALAAAAAGKVIETAIAAASTNPATASSETNRIVVPTGSNEAPRNTREDELDEATVISARPPAAAYETRAPQTRASAPPPTKSSPWRIIIPALAGLIVLFGVVYAITYRGSSAEPNTNQTPGMTADPNSKPVQPAPPPTGNAEAGITPGNSNAANSNTSGPETKNTENKNAEGGAENSNAGNSNSKGGGQKNGNDNQGGQTDNSTPPEGNKNQGDEPPPAPKPENKNSIGDAPGDKPKPKKAEPTNLPPPPPTSNISQQEQ
jgi:serine/threonine-protein kinase